MKSTLNRIHSIMTWLIFAGSIIQFFQISLTFSGVIGSKEHGSAGSGLAEVSAAAD